MNESIVELVIGTIALLIWLLLRYNKKWAKNVGEKGIEVDAEIIKVEECSGEHFGNLISKCDIQFIYENRLIVKQFDFEGTKKVGTRLNAFYIPEKDDLVLKQYLLGLEHESKGNTGFEKLLIVLVVLFYLFSIIRPIKQLGKLLKYISTKISVPSVSVDSNSIDYIFFVLLIVILVGIILILDSYKKLKKIKENKKDEVIINAIVKSVRSGYMHPDIHDDDYKEVYFCYPKYSFVYNNEVIEKESEENEKRKIEKGQNIDIIYNIKTKKCCSVWINKQNKNNKIAGVIIGILMIITGLVILIIK